MPETLSTDQERTRLADHAMAEGANEAAGGVSEDQAHEALKGHPGFEGEPWTRQPNETAKAFRAFVAYRDMGAGRTLAKVAEAWGHPASYDGQLSRWSSANRWTERAELWDMHLEALARAAHEQTHADLMAEAGRIARLGFRAVSKALRALTSEDAPPMSAREAAVIGDMSARLAAYAERSGETFGAELGDIAKRLRERRKARGD